MKKNQKILIRAVSLLMTVLLISATFCCVTLTAGAVVTTKKEKTYDIAVVFDNSGSMYNNSSWCEAKYAMEIFASMLDFSKDRLTIYPMWEITTDESSSEKATYAPLKITSNDDIKKIHNMYTPTPGNTPFAPVREAERDLKKSKADEKWLIVMTDGGFNQDERNVSAGIALEAELKTMANENLKVQYLGFAGATRLDSDETGYFYSKSSSATSLKNDLVDICNKIFQRIALPKNKLSGNKLTLDVSMKKLIVFVQGADASVESLSSAQGDKVEVKQKSDKIVASNKSAGGGYSSAPEAENLSGQVVTFGECKAGEYNLEYTLGTEGTIQIFYEPDIDIKVELINSDGQTVRPENGDVIYEGEYTLKTTLIDSVTGDEVTDSELLKIDSLETRYQVDDGDWQLYSKYGESNDKKLNLEADKTYNVVIEGTYLTDYTIKSEDDPELEWLKIIKPEIEVIPFEVHAEVLQNDSYYCHVDSKNEWQPIKVTFTFDGKPLTKEQFERVEISHGFDAALDKHTVEKVDAEMAYYFYINAHRDKEKKEPTGEYTFTVNAVYTDEKGRETVAVDKVNFKISKVAKWIIDLIWLLITLAVLTLIALWLLHPVLPKRVIISEGHFTKNATIRGSFKMPSRYDIRSVPVSGKAKVVPKMRNAWIMSILKPRRMNFKIVDVTCSGIVELTIDGVTYTAQNGKLYDSAGTEVKSMIISNSAVSWDENKGGLFSGTLNINRR